jgi:hypothetical protein
MPPWLAGDDLSTVANESERALRVGMAPTQVLRADEALPILAVSTWPDPEN